VIVGSAIVRRVITAPDVASAVARVTELVGELAIAMRER
jgi:tryptophan synthase alpha subunit